MTEPVDFRSNCCNADVSQGYICRSCGEHCDRVDINAIDEPEYTKNECEALEKKHTPQDSINAFYDFLETHVDPLEEVKQSFRTGSVDRMNKRRQMNENNLARIKREMK